MPRFAGIEGNFDVGNVLEDSEIISVLNEMGMDVENEYGPNWRNNRIKEISQRIFQLRGNFLTLNH